MEDNHHIAPAGTLLPEDSPPSCHPIAGVHISTLVLAFSSLLASGCSAFKPHECCAVRGQPCGRDWYCQYFRDYTNSTGIKVLSLFRSQGAAGGAEGRKGVILS